MYLFSLIFVGLSTYTLSQVIGRDEFGAKLAENINKKLNGSQLLIQNMTRDVNNGSIELKKGKITNLQITYIAVSLFPQEDQLEFQFISNNFSTLFPLEVTYNKLRNEGNLTFYTHYVIMIPYSIVEVQENCAVKSANITLKFKDSVEFETDYFSAKPKNQNAIVSDITKFGRDVILPVLKDEVVKLLQGIADDSIYQVIISTFGANGYKGCKKYVPYKKT